MNTQAPDTLVVTLQRDAEGQFFEIPPEFEFSGEQVWMAKTTLGLLTIAQFEPSEAGAGTEAASLCVSAPVSLRLSSRT